MISGIRVWDFKLMINVLIAFAGLHWQIYKNTQVNKINYLIITKKCRDLQLVAVIKGKKEKI